MNTYACFYRGKSVEVKSDTTYHAQLEATKVFKAKKSYEVSVLLSVKDGEEVIHRAID